MYKYTPPSVWTLSNKHRSTRKQKIYNIKRIIELVIATPLLLKYKTYNAYTFVFNRLHFFLGKYVNIVNLREFTLILNIFESSLYYYYFFF